MTSLLVAILSFGFVALAANHIGAYSTRWKLPLVSGFLIAGIVSGPFVLSILAPEDLDRLGFIDDLALAAIGFAAGGELFLGELRDRLRSIRRITVGLVTSTMIIGSIVVFSISGMIPVMGEMPAVARIAVSVLVASVLVARSPSSAIAIVNEMRAKGPFTQTVLGVTVIMDAVVIVIFAISHEAAVALTSTGVLNVRFLVDLTIEMLMSLAAGVAIWRVLVFILAQRAVVLAKMLAVLAIGYGVFAFADALGEYTNDSLGHRMTIEPLLACMIGALLVTNRSAYRTEFANLLHKLSPPIFVAFFSLTGASLELSVLTDTWQIALVLVGIRLVTIAIGSFLGGTLAGDPPRQNRILWMAFITQAGVGIGLSKDIGAEFGDWGSQLATILIAAIVVNQLLGPPFFKWAIQILREAHTRAPGAPFDGVRDVIIFGSGGGHSQALAKQLASHDWTVKVAILDPHTSETGQTTSEIPTRFISEISRETLGRLDAAHADAIVCLLADDERNFELCELVYEAYGIETVVVRLHETRNFERFHALGALVVDPSTAMVSLLEHLVISPTATSLLLGYSDEQELIELEVRDPSLDGVLVRSLTLPDDTLLISIRRDGHTIVTHGFTSLRLRDRVTLVGPPKKVHEATLIFDA